MGDWQPIKTAPKDGTAFLGYWKFKNSPFHFIQPMKWMDGRFIVTWDHDDENTPTHWQPLPLPPEAQE